MAYTIRPMTPDDVPAVAEIDRRSNPLPWSQASFTAELDHRLARYLVAVDSDQQVVGFAGLWLMVGEAHITMIAVDPAHRRRGVGELLLVSALRLAAGEAQSVLTLEVRPSNETAIALYRKYGLVEVGRRPRYYGDTGEDALIFTSPPLDSPAYQARLRRLAAVFSARPAGGVAGPAANPS